MVNTAKVELGGLVKGLGNNIKTMQVKMPNIRPKENANVLPRLSINDQVAELERIIEGLKENVFTADQLEVVRNELYGLRKFLQSGAKEKESDDPENAVIFGILRDKRLEEALSLLPSDKK